MNKCKPGVAASADFGECARTLANQGQKERGVRMTFLHSRWLSNTCVRLASAMRSAAGNVPRGGLMACLALAALTALPSAPATAQTIYVGNGLSNPDPGVPYSADTSPPLVILGEYNPAGPSSTSAVNFASAGNVTSVQFYGGGTYNFTLYALALVSNASGQLTFRVDAAQSISGQAATFEPQTVAISNFAVNAGDLLAFAGIGPYYPQIQNDAAGSDAAYANSVNPPDPFTATPPPAVVGTVFSVSAVSGVGNTGTTYDYISNYFGNQGRIYAIGVNYTPAAYTIGGTLAGLTGSGPLVLQDNGGDNLSLTANGPFTFATPIASGQTYSVTVLSSPPGQYCTVNGGTGTVGNGPVTTVNVVCAPTTNYAYSGHAFTLFECATSPKLDCASPGPGNPYTTSDSVSATLSLTTPLGPNLPPTNVIYLPGFVSLTMNDGQNSITVTPSTCSGEFCNGSAYVTTDGNGNINAWWLDANYYSQGVSTEDIHTLYDPTGTIGANCQYCYDVTYDPQGTLPNPLGEDEGSFSTNTGGANVYRYGYVLKTPGSFLPPGPGGSVVVTPTTCTAASPCQLTPTVNLGVILAPGVTLPSGAVISETQCFVPADPRGPNCGAVDGKLPTSLKISTLPQCAGFGNEVIPPYACGASGPSGTGFWLNYGVAESLDATNGLNVIATATPPPGSITRPCPPAVADPVGAYPYAIILGGTRTASNTEEQHPEGTLIDITAGCDNARGLGGPGASIVGVGFELVQSYQAGRFPVTNLEILLGLANYDYLNTYAVLALANFPKTPPVRAQLLQCLAKSQVLVNQGNYTCSAQEIYHCEQILESTPVADVGPTTKPVRLPDPYGDLKSRFYHQFFLTNSQIGGNPPISLADVPPGGPYPSCPSQ
jgi:hypothetical protein